jgi:hypothetical protein
VFISSRSPTTVSEPRSSSAADRFVVHQAANLEFEGKRFSDGGSASVPGCACDQYFGCYDSLPVFIPAYHLAPLLVRLRFLTAGDQAVYVNEKGTIVQAPTTTTVQTAQPVQPAVDTQHTVTTHDEVLKSQSRYELLEKKGNKEIYMDHQTGKKVTVKRDKD